MTGQSLLDRMELLNEELQLQSGEADVTRGLLALNIAQDYLEGEAARRSHCYPTISPTAAPNFYEVPTVSGQPYLDLQDTVLRVDAVQYVITQTGLTGVTTVPQSTLTPRYDAGGQQGNGTGWLTQSWSNATPSGVPTAYWQQGYRLWFDPIPNGVYTMRIIGLIAAPDITASGTFLYSQTFALPLASFACGVLKLGVDDDPTALTSLAGAAFNAGLDSIQALDNSGPKPLNYTQDHR